MKKKLVTERDVTRLPAGGTLEIGRDTLVTPAARDLAFVRGIVLVDPARATSASGRICCEGCSAGKPCAAARWPALADGDWLLEVRGGRVRARRVE
jgi:hypothetical protein